MMTTFRNKRIKNRSRIVKLSDIIDKFMRVKSLEGLAPRTMKDYEKTLGYFTNYLGEDISIREIDIELIRRYISYMFYEQNYSEYTVNIRIRTLRSFLRYCFNESIITDPVHTKFKPMKTIQDKIESFTPVEVNKIISVIDTVSYVGFRDKVMIYVLLDTMVRISELISIKKKNIDLNQGFIKLEAQDTKTKSLRYVPLSDKTIELIKEYLFEVDDFNSDYLFLTHEGKSMKTNSFQQRITDYGKKAEITTKRVSAHTFRHTGALFYILNGGDPFSLQKILGHTSIAMVRRYVKLSDQNVKDRHDEFTPLNMLEGDRNK